MPLYVPSPKKSNGHPSSFARGAVFAEFQPKHARAIDQGDFVDRPPRIDEIGDRR